MASTNHFCFACDCHDCKIHNCGIEHKCLECLYQKRVAFCDVKNIPEKRKVVIRQAKRN